MKLWHKCKNIILKLIIVICVITLIVIGFILLKDYLECRSNNKDIADLSFDERLEDYKNASQVKVDDIEITDKIIKLSTCSYLNSRTSPTDQRYYIIATLNEVN